MHYWDGVFLSKDDKDITRKLILVLDKVKSTYDAKETHIDEKYITNEMQNIHLDVNTYKCNCRFN